MELALLDTVHDELSGVVAGMMGAACGYAPPRPHLSFMAIGGTEEQAEELSKMVNAVFGLDLSVDTVIGAPTPDALARVVALEWFRGEGSAAELLALIAAIADDD